jgi:hypothetical protein
MASGGIPAPGARGTVDVLRSRPPSRLHRLKRLARRVPPGIALDVGAVAAVLLAVTYASSRGMVAVLLLLPLLLGGGFLAVLSGWLRPVEVSVLAGILCLLTTRSNILGEAFGIVGSAGWLVVAATSRSWLRHPRTVPLLAGVAASVLAYWAYIVLLDALRASSLQAVVAAGADTLGGLAVRSVLATGAAVVGCWALAVDRERGPRFVKALVALGAWQVLGYLVLVPLWQVAGPRAGLVATINPQTFGGRDADFGLYATGILTTGGGGFASAVGPRLTGWTGEPGILGATLLLVAFAAAVTPGVSLRWRTAGWLVALLGVVCAQSTASVLTAALGAVVALVTVPATRAGRLQGAVWAGTVGAFAFGALLFSRFGLRGKGEQSQVSVTDRLNGVGTPRELFETWLHAPFGAPVANGGSVGVNLVQESLRYGVLVALLATVAFLSPAVGTGAMRRLAPAVIMLLATAWFAQPGMANPLWLALSMIAAGGVAREQRKEVPVPTPNGRPLTGAVAIR